MFTGGTGVSPLAMCLCVVSLFCTSLPPACICVGSLRNWSVPGVRCCDCPMALAQQTGIPKWVALVSGNLDQHLRVAPPVLFGATPKSVDLTLPFPLISLSNQGTQARPHFRSELATQSLNFFFTKKGSNQTCAPWTVTGQKKSKLVVYPYNGLSKKLRKSNSGSECQTRMPAFTAPCASNTTLQKRATEINLAQKLMGTPPKGEVAGFMCLSQAKEL